ILIRNPLNSPASRPWSSVGTRIIHSYLILQCVQIRSRETFNQVKRFSMWQPAGPQPELFIETDGIRHQRVLLPMADRTAVITRHLLRGLTQRASIRIDDSPVAIPAAQQNKNAAH